MTIQEFNLWQFLDVAGLFTVPFRLRSLKECPYSVFLYMIKDRKSPGKLMFLVFL